MPRFMRNKFQSVANKTQIRSPWIPESCRVSHPFLRFLFWGRSVGVLGPVINGRVTLTKHDELAKKISSPQAEQRAEKIKNKTKQNKG